MVVCVKPVKLRRPVGLGWVAWSLAAFYFFYEFLLRTYVGTFSRQMIADLHLGTQTFSLLGTGYFIAYGAMQIPAGLLVDRFGVKRIMSLGVLICVVSALLLSVSVGFVPALFSRFLMGLGSSFAFVSLIWIVVTWLPRRLKGFLIGLSQLLGTVGPLVGTGLLSWALKMHHSWRFTLMVVAVSGLVLLGLILYCLPWQATKREGQCEKIALPIRRQLRLLFFNARAWVWALYSAMVYVSLGVMGVVWGVPYLEAEGISSVLAGEIVSLSWLGYAVGCLVLGGMSDRFQSRKPFVCFASVLGIIVTILMAVSPWSHAKSAVVNAALFFGLGVAGSGQNVGLTLMTEQVGTEIKAAAVGFNNGMISIFDSAAPLVMGCFIQISTHLSAHLARQGDVSGLAASHRLVELQGFHAALGLLPILYVGALLLAVFSRGA